MHRLFIDNHAVPVSVTSGLNYVNLNKSGCHSSGTPLAQGQSLLDLEAHLYLFEGSYEPDHENEVLLVRKVANGFDLVKSWANDSTEAITYFNTVSSYCEEQNIKDLVLVVAEHVFIFDSGMTGSEEDDAREECEAPMFTWFRNNPDAVLKFCVYTTLVADALFADEG